jgi:hypothetical protein
MNKIQNLTNMKKQTFFIVSLMALWATCLHAQELIPYRSGELWGYCTPDKKIVIEPQFEFASWFYEGLARVANHCDYDCYDVKNIIENMTDDLHETAKALKEMGDEQNVMITDKDNSYAGKMLFDVMENAMNACKKGIPLESLGFEPII